MIQREPIVPQRQHVIPVEPMAYRLAGYPPRDRASPEAAIVALIQDRAFCRDDIEAGVDRALELAREIAAGAASDALWARCIGWLRDGISLAVLCVGLPYAWAFLS